MDILLKETREAPAIARGQIGVLRGLLAEALGVIDEAAKDTDDIDELDSLLTLSWKIEKAIEGTLP